MFNRKKPNGLASIPDTELLAEAGRREAIKRTKRTIEYHKEQIKGHELGIKDAEKQLAALSPEADSDG